MYSYTRTCTIVYTLEEVVEKLSVKYMYMKLNHLKPKLYNIYIIYIYNIIYFILYI